MRCRVYENVDYLNLPLILSAIKNSLYDDALAAIQPKKFPGLSQRPSRIEDIPGVSALPESHVKTLEAQISDIIESAVQHKSSWPFLEPVDVKDAPDYYDVVHSPTDLSTMRKRNAQRSFRTADSLR